VDRPERQQPLLSVLRHGSQQAGLRLDVLELLDEIRRTARWQPEDLAALHTTKAVSPGHLHLFLQSAGKQAEAMDQPHACRRGQDRRSAFGPQREKLIDWAPARSSSDGEVKHGLRRKAVAEPLEEAAPAARYLVETPLNRRIRSFSRLW
jgi:hypothetical protein